MQAGVFGDVFDLIHQSNDDGGDDWFVYPFSSLSTRLSMHLLSRLHTHTLTQTHTQTT